MNTSESHESKHDAEKHLHHDGANMNAWPNTRDDDIEHTIEEAEEDHTTAKAEKPTNTLTTTLSRTISRRSAASSWQDPGPPPEGGITAWTQVFCAHLTIFTTFGFTTSFGVYQTYYETTLGIAPSTISWIGSMQIFLLFGIGTFTGRATDAGLFKHVYIAGAVFQIVGIFTMAESTKLWQLFLSQAVCLGIANGLQFCPAMALVSTYFVKKRAFVMGFTALGSCTGGVVFPTIVQQCLPTLGFPWTIRIIGFIMLVFNIITISLYRTRLPPRKSGAIVDWESFKELPYALYCIAMFFTFWGLYFAFFYVGSYGRNVLGVSYQQSINLLLTIVCTGFVFRLLPNWIADRFGSLNVMIPFAFLCGIMMFGWIGIHSTGALFAFAAIYGSGSAVVQALWPAIIGSTSRDGNLKKAGVRMGMAFTIVSFSSLTGPPLAGALIQQHGGSYTYANVWAGTSFFVGGALLIATRWSLAGWDLKARI
ncbi:MFS-type transporter [Fulvia fulva]|uniref:MFS-type transporter n=1 Tax=Passalora fulva TaxID=5499 RepID=A0A9Q8PH90_PASFU|nr:MFS-type transporter [Fulvia fulva]KAK4613870.1 MFS-type transporter [Fulvia fulva]KAK4614436.1 MFS-type transporter [Fulvia fulva]UJO22387.1 MFS-type transporter [Fulvia fulva]WPV20269.1 MFS-type transporter [Fulvia fulva]WPV35610.1 MFS-type transporter [Fulvia fulva]